MRPQQLLFCPIYRTATKNQKRTLLLATAGAPKKKFRDRSLFHLLRALDWSPMKQVPAPEFYGKSSYFLEPFDSIKA